MSLLDGIADALRQMAGQATAGEYVVLGNRLAQAADLIGAEAFAADRFTPLAIEDASDDAVGIVNGKTPNEVDRVFVSAHAGWIETGQMDVAVGDQAAFPA